MFKCVENQPVVDGILTGSGLLWLCQSKSTVIRNKNAVSLTPGQFTSISAYMLKTLDQIDGVPENVKVVLDLYTTRAESPRLNYVAIKSKHVKQTW